MPLLWMSEVLRLDTMKSLCCMLDRNFKRKKHWSKVRDVKYWSWQFHYTETVEWHIIYSFSDKYPRAIMNEIIERANALIY